MEAYGSASLATVINSRVTETCLYTGTHAPAHHHGLQHTHTRTYILTHSRALTGTYTTHSHMPLYKHIYLTHTQNTVEIDEESLNIDLWLPHSHPHKHIHISITEAYLI